jgi:serine/threonine protein kinase
MTNFICAAKDLIRHLLEMDPDKRYTATQALQHRWFKVFSFSFFFDFITLLLFV